MPTLKDRLDLMKEFNVPIKERNGKMIKDDPNLYPVYLVLENNIKEVIVPVKDKIEVFGYLSSLFRAPYIEEISENLSMMSWQEYSPFQFFKKNDHGFASLEMKL